MKTLHRIPTVVYGYIDFEFDDEAAKGTNGDRFLKNLEAHLAMNEIVKKKLSTQNTQQ